MALLLPRPESRDSRKNLIHWCAAFGVPKSLTSDGPSHFESETVRLILKGLKAPHHFTVPCCPWSNGGIELVGKELLRTFRVVLSEPQLPSSKCPDLLPVIQSALNYSPSPQRGNVAPITAFTGTNPLPPIFTFIRTISC